MVADQPKITIPLSLGDIYNALCPDCQQRVVDMVSAKAGPDFIRRAIEAQLSSPSAHPELAEGPHDPR